MSVNTLEQHCAPGPGRLDRFSGLTRAGTNAGREVVAGLTTFGAMSYVLVVVGLLMLRGLAEPDTSVPENALPPLLIATTTNLMIALCWGCFVYTLIVVARGQIRKLTPMLIGLDVTLCCI